MFTHQTGDTPSTPPTDAISNTLPHSRPSVRPRTDATITYGKLADIWRASPPPRAWVVALAFLMIDGFILVQTYEAGRETGFQLAELSR
jgi:hypothetical protein